MDYGWWMVDSSRQRISQFSGTGKGKSAIHNPQSTAFGQRLRIVDGDVILAIN